MMNILFNDMSKKEIERKPRKKKKNQLSEKDLQKPIKIDLSVIGTDDDCFGKHYAPAYEECASCGDSEMCAILLGKVNHAKRAKIEKETPYKDLEEAANTDSFMSFKKLKEVIEIRVKKKGSISFNLLCKQIQKKYDPAGLVETRRIKDLVKNVVIESKNLKKKSKDGKPFVMYRK